MGFGGVTGAGATDFRLRRGRGFRRLCRFAFAGLSQAEQLRFERADAPGKFVDAIFGVDGADNQPNSQGERDSENDQDDQSNYRFHKFCLSTGDATWLPAMCASPPIAGKPQMRAPKPVAFICRQDNAAGNRGMN